MLEIKKKKKVITVSDIYSDINLIYKEFTNKQVDLIVGRKVFCLFYKSNYVITNIPETITHIVFDYNCINLNTIPFLHSKISHIEFNIKFNNPVDNLPADLKNVQFGHKFNQPVDNLPNGLMRLVSGESFNHPVDHLPETLEILFLGRNFNKPVDNLPSGLRYIFFGMAFSYPIDNLPDSIETIKFASSNRYGRDITKLPSSIKIIRLPWSFESRANGGKIQYHIITAKIPETIQKIIFPIRYPKDLIEKLNLPEEKFKINPTYY